MVKGGEFEHHTAGRVCLKKETPGFEHSGPGVGNGDANLGGMLDCQNPGLGVRWQSL